MKLLVVFFATLELALGGKYTYTIKTVTATEGADGMVHNGTNRDIQVSLQGRAGSRTEFISLNNKNKDNFVQGATDEFRIKSNVSVSHIKCLVLQNNGDDYWLLDQASVTINGKTTKFYNTDLVGLSNDKGEGRDELILCVCSKYTYTVKTTTAPKGAYGKNGTGTDGNVHISIQDEDGIHMTEFTRLNNKEVDDLEAGATDIFLIESGIYIKKVKCIVLRNTGSDYWLLDKVVITNNGRGTTFYNYDAVALSTDPKEGKRQIKMCIQGIGKYALTVVTSAIEHGDSDKIFISMTIKGRHGGIGRTSLISNTIPDFESGQLNKFYFYNLPILNVECITLKANKGGDDMWAFDRVILYGAKQTLDIKAPNTKLSSKTEEAKDEVELCYTP